VSRDLIGYAGDPPDPQWPGGARVAVNFVLNLEEGSEPSIGDGDGRSETALTEVTGARLPPGERDLAAEGMFAYGSRVGFWRVRRLFQERGLTLTAFACAQALERNPAIAKAVRESGWDVCAHGNRWVEHWRMDAQTEAREIAAAVASLARTVGAPAGWYCRYGPSVNTRQLLLRHGGFQYDSDAYDDEIPYWTQVEGRSHLVIPYSLATNDAKFSGGNLGTGREFFEWLKEGLDFLRREPRGRMFSVGLHARLVGHPGRASGLAQFLDHVASLTDVWVCQRLDIARHWSARFAPAPAVLELRRGPDAARTQA